MKAAIDRRLTQRLVRPGTKLLKLDATKAKKPRFPFIQKKAKDRVNTLEHLRRVGRVSMIQIGDDEFRTPTRAERRQAGIRHRGTHPLAAIAQKRGVARLRAPLAVAPRPTVEPRTCNRKQKQLRKAILEHNAEIERMAAAA